MYSIKAGNLSTVLRDNHRTGLFSAMYASLWLPARVSSGSQTHNLLNALLQSKVISDDVVQGLKPCILSAHQVCIIKKKNCYQ